MSLNSLYMLQELDGLIRDSIVRMWMFTVFCSLRTYLDSYSHIYVTLMLLISSLDP